MTPSLKPQMETKLTQTAKNPHCMDATKLKDLDGNSVSIFDLCGSTRRNERGVRSLTIAENEGDYVIVGLGT